ncbi:MAG: hypothetical protein ACP5O0_11610 [Acidimicrobiales bacterium]
MTRSIFYDRMKAVRVVLTTLDATVFYGSLGKRSPAASEFTEANPVARLVTALVTVATGLHSRPHLWSGRSR